MNSQLAFSALTTVALFASTVFAQAQGTSGSAGVASIPSSVVRAAEQGQPVTQRGLIGLIFGSASPAPDADSRQKTPRRGQNPLPSR